MRMPEIEQRVEELVEPIVAEQGYFLVDVEIRQRHRDMVLTLYLDSAAGGIDLDTMAQISEEIGRHLDVADLITSSYMLEVASPGLERVLRKPREFRWFKGRQAVVKLKQPYDGSSTLRGELGDAGEQEFHILVEGADLVFPYEAVKQVKLAFEWGSR
jgi:ribosome maturation factor RimP